MLAPELVGYCVVSFIAGGAVTLGACIMYRSIKHERQMRAMEEAMSGGREWHAVPGFEPTLKDIRRRVGQQYQTMTIVEGDK